MRVSKMAKKPRSVVETLDPKVIEFVARIAGGEPIASPGPGGTSSWLRDNLPRVVTDEQCRTLYEDVRLANIKVPPTLDTWEKFADNYLGRPSLQVPGYLGGKPFGYRQFGTRSTKWNRVTRLRSPHGFVRVYENEGLPGVRLYVVTDESDARIFGTKFMTKGAKDA